FHGYDKEIVGVTQGCLGVCAVIATERARRYSLQSQQRMVGAELAAAGQGGPGGPGPDSGTGGEGPTSPSASCSSRCCWRSCGR
ncbi:hypothetical protein CLM82_28990, partial [Streptomyces albidoflavus]